MTSPTNVGQVSVEVVASAKALAKSLKKEVESAFKDLDFGKAIQDSVGRTKVKIQVDPEVDTNGIGEKVKRTRVPKIPVEVDPLMTAFQQEVRRQSATLSRQALKIPIDADAGRLRTEVGAQIAAIRAQSRLTVPTEPGSKAEYETKLKAQLAEVAARVKQTVKVEVDTKGGGIGDLSGTLGKSLSGFTSGRGFSQLFTGVFTGLQSAVGTLLSSLKDVQAASQTVGGSLSGAFSSAAGPIGAAIGLTIALGAAMTAATIGAYALGPAVGLIAAALSAAAGAAAAIPAALAGAGAAIGTLALGFRGIAQAFKPKTGGGGGGGGEDPESRARRIAAAERGVEAARRGIAAATRGLQSAERGLADAQRGVATAEQAVTDAQKRAQLAQQAINKARVEAREDIDDLNRSLRGARLSEEDAALGVTEALRALNEVKLTGNLPDIQRADLAYRQAQQTLEDAKDTTEDLAAASQDANKKGVEGSDKVVSALQDQQDALRSVKDAQQGVSDAQNRVVEAQNGVLSANDSLKASYDGLKSAQDSLAESQKKAAAGAAAAAAKLIKLAPAAQKFVDAVKALKPAFEDLRLDVQQKLFEGLDKTVTNLGRAWIPALKTTLGNYADTFNGFFKSLGASITTPKFISDLQAGAEGARQGLSKIGDSITTSLVPAFGTLSRAAGPFLSQLGEELATVVTKFGEWVEKADKSGSLKTFFDRATSAMHDLFTTGTLVTQIIGDIFEIITGTKSTTSGKTALDGLNDGLTHVKEYLDDPKNQQKIRDFFSKIGGAAQQFKDAAGQADGLITKLEGMRLALFGPGDKDKGYTFGQDIGAAIVFGILAGITGTVTLQNGIVSAVVHHIIDQFKELFGIQSPSTVFAEIGADIIQGLIGGVLGTVPNLAATFASIKDKVVTAVGNASAWLTQKGTDAVTGIRNGFNRALGALSSTAGTARTTVQNKLSDAGSWLVNHGNNVVVGLRNGFNRALGGLSSTAASARTVITNQLVNAGSLLYNHGRSVINGLINGIRSALGSLGSFLGGVGTFIQQHKGPLDADRKLLVGAGQAIMGGLIAGIDDGKADLVAKLADVTGLVAGTDLPGLTAGADAAFTRSLTAASSNQLLASWAPGATGDPILDGLRRIIKFQYKGDVTAALSTG